MANMDPLDLQVKYQKLATEYSKLRAQNQVLKKAVVEEQSKRSQLKDVLKSKEQALRKVEQEIDSLHFRNQQLTKRLVLLQDDLDHSKSKSFRNPSNQETVANPSILDNNVYAEELQSKIDENAKLHAHISDLEIFYKNKIVELENKLDETLKNSSKNTEFNRSQEQMLQNELRKLESERAKQELFVQQKEADVLVLQNEMRDLKRQINNCDLPSELDVAFNTVNENLTPRTLELESPTKLLGKLGRRKLLNSLVEPIGQVSSSFVGFFNSYSNLLKTSSNVSQSRYIISQLTDENFVWESLAKHYEKIAKSVKESEDDFIALDSLSGLEMFSKSVEKCSKSLRKVLPLLCEKLYFNEDQIDAPWRSSLGSLVGCWAAIIPYLSSLAAHSDERTVLTTGAISKILSLLRNRLNKLCSTSQDLLTAWELLSTQGVHEAKISSNLQMLNEAFSKIYSLFSENINSCTSPGSSCVSTPSSTFSAANANFPTLSSPDSVSWSVGVHDGLADCEVSLAQQLAQSTSRLTKLEEEREHWRLEYQLLNHKYEKELKKSQNLEQEVKLRSKDCDFQDNSITKESDLSVSTSSIGEVTLGSEATDERENEIRKHFTTRCSHLYMQLTTCTSQAALYQDECETLMRRLVLSEESKSVAEQDLDAERKERAKVQEALATTSRNYEEQISAMSEHLADLNEKITNQADLVEQLKFESKKKGRKL